MSKRLFGMNLPTNVTADDDPVQVARLAEELGYDFVSSSDHPIGDTATNETWTLLSWVAASTSQVKVATRVLGVPFRLPTLTAKMAETLDRLSSGRLILGLGAGAQDAEIAALGGSFLGAGEKVEALEEAVRIIRGLWGGPDFTYRGQHHTAEAATISPRPAGSIPIWLGSYGPRSLAVAGRVADGWIPSLSYAGINELPRMRRQLMDSAEASGRLPGAVSCILNVAIVPGRSHEDGVVAGTTAQLVEQLSAFLEMGFDGFNFMFPRIGMEDAARMVASDVLPSLNDSETSRDGMV